MSNNFFRVQYPPERGIKKLAPASQASSKLIGREQLAKVLKDFYLSYN